MIRAFGNIRDILYNRSYISLSLLIYLHIAKTIMIITLVMIDIDLYLMYDVFSVIDNTTGRLEKRKSIIIDIRNIE